MDIFYEETDEVEKEKNYLDTAKKFLGAVCILSIISLATYFYALIYNEFDFGFIFEIIGLLFGYLAYFRTKYKEITKAKRNIIVACISIGWLVIYDIILMIMNIDNLIEFVSGYSTYYGEYLFGITLNYAPDFMLLANLLLYYISYKNLTLYEISEYEKDVKEKNNTNNISDQIKNIDNNTNNNTDNNI